VQLPKRREDEETMRDRASRRRFDRRIGSVLSMLVSVAAMAAIVGCASVSPMIERHPLDTPGAPQAVAVIASPEAPTTRLQAYARGRPEGAAKGAVGGAAAGAYVILMLAGPLIVFAPAVLGAGAAIGLAAGAAAGAEVAVPEEQAAAIERLAADAVGQLRLPELTAAAMAGIVKKSARLEAAVVDSDSQSDPATFRALRERGFGVAIQFTLKEVGFEASGSDTVLALFMTAEARLVDTATGKPVALRGLVYVSPRQAHSRWTQEGAALLTTEVERARQTLAERIVEGLVLQADDGAKRSGWLAEADPLTNICDLAPRSPQRTGDGEYAAPVGAKEFSVESVTPTLAWELAPVENRRPPDSVNWRPGETPAPTEVARKALPPGAAESDIAYDLRIWNVVDGAPASLVYERERLNQPQHRVETALEPDSTYFWSVRMRYVVDGRERATRWSAANVPPFFLPPPLWEVLFYSRMDDGAPKPVPCSAYAMTPCGCLDFIPAPNYFRFRTPGPARQPPSR
jgi:hypothetical protein